MSERLSVVVLIHVRDGRKAEFEQVERLAQVILSRHGGRVEQRLVCAGSTSSGGDGGTEPDEVHVVSFPDEAAFMAYRTDPAYVALAPARDAAVRETKMHVAKRAPALDEREPDPLRIVGVDHVYLSVTNMARSEEFYDAVMAALGFRKGDKAIAGEKHAHYFNPVTQVTLRPSRLPDRADPYRAGLHHMCLQADGERGVDAAHARLTKLGVAATEPRKYPEYNPDYYATFFEDPDGIRFEIVARTPHRDRVARRWNDFRVFLNPVTELLEREAKDGKT